MFPCTDPVVDYLAQFGFNVIRLPRAGLTPGDVLGGKGPRLEPIGSITQAWVTDRPAPIPTPPTTAAMLVGKSTADLDVKAGLSVAEQLLSPFGVSGPKLKAGLGNASALRFGFGKPQIWSIAPLDLGRFLGAGALIDSNPVATAFFGPGAPPVHIITDLLISSSMTIDATVGAGNSGSLDFKALQEMVTCQVEIAGRNDRGTTVQFKGKEPLAFGFRAVKAQIVDAKWTLHGFPKPGSVMYSNAPAPAAWAALFPPGETTIG